MEIRVFPRGYNLVRRPADDEGTEARVSLTILDADGTTAVTATFSEQSWAEFAAFVADPEEAAARQRAREAIVGPGGRAPSISARRRSNPLSG